MSFSDVAVEVDDKDKNRQGAGDGDEIKAVETVGEREADDCNSNETSNNEPRSLAQFGVGKPFMCMA